LLHLGALLSDERRARADLLRDLPVRLLRVRLEQRRDQLALHLGGEVPAVDVEAVGELDRVSANGGLPPDPFMETTIVDHDAAEQLQGVEPVAPIEQLEFSTLLGRPQHDRGFQSVALDVAGKFLQLLLRQQRKGVGDRVHLKVLAPVLRQRRKFFYISHRKVLNRASRLHLVPGFFSGRAAAGSSYSATGIISASPWRIPMRLGPSLMNFSEKCRRR
jgi:hypothetical protein